MSVPGVMVSSTYYDLRQVRADLTQCIDGMGYRALLSELPSFPVDPDLATVDNCRRRVQDTADLFVLVVGGRYGHVPTGHEHSVTNLEYLTARAKGIPIYVFISRAVLDVLPMWRLNPGADFSHIVDDQRVLRFASELYGPGGEWVYPFETAQDICAVLRTQFAHLFGDSLRLRSLYVRAPDRELINRMSASGVRLFLERPDAWQYLLFFQHLRDKIAMFQDVLDAYDAGLSHGHGEIVVNSDAIQWCRARNDEFQRIVDSANQVFGRPLLDAFGAVGEECKPDRLLWCAEVLAELLQHAVEWSKRIGRAHASPPFDDVLRELSVTPHELISSLRRYPVESTDAITASIAAPSTVQGGTLTLCLVMKYHNLEGVQRALRHAERWVSVHGL